MTVTTTALSYNGYVTQVATLAVLQQTLITTGTSPNSLVTSSDPNFTNVIPQMLNYAELRIQRDLDFLATQNQKTTTVSATSTNQFALPSQEFVTLQTVTVTDPNGGVTPLLPISKSFLQNVYATNGATGTPQYFAVYGNNQLTSSSTVDSNQNIIFGPWTPATGTYTFTITGTTRQPTLYNFAVSGQADTNYTFISQNLPDMLVMASMIYISAYQRNFGRINDDPAMAQTYESQYQALMKGAMVEEARKKYQAAGWTSYSPSPVATPTR
jgi:hypothetical protein